ncbi:hypothetical protein CK203_055759 [Vitis vinifera]|uniref:Uncharacterized protein n=1 Tax=Vitis vinifera TaxID=29760 RepID=A0A438H113_VITVI|nr:hypothetical protein CK203_055759 [Vitis vinifera]
MRSLHVINGIMSWDGYDDLPVAAFPVEFRMSDIERYIGIGCPRIHLKLYSAIMLGHRHLMGFPQTNFGFLVQALYGIKKGISRGLWANSSPSYSKGKKSGSRPMPSNVGTIGMIRHRPAIPIRLAGPAYLHPSP